MDTRRQLKIASLIKEAFTEILSREGKGLFGKAFITITNVVVTSDLTLARFYLSIYNAENADDVVKKFTEHKYELKKHLASALRHHLRRIPELEFFRDDTLDYVQRIEEVFKKIKEDDLQISKSAAKEEKVKTPVKAKAKKAPAKKKAN